MKKIFQNFLKIALIMIFVCCTSVSAMNSEIDLISYAKIKVECYKSIIYYCNDSTTIKEEIDSWRKSLFYFISNLTNIEKVIVFKKIILDLYNNPCFYLERVNLKKDVTFKIDEKRSLIACCVQVDKHTQTIYYI